MPLHRLYGLTVDSEFTLPAPVVEAERADITVVWGHARAVPEDPPQGRILSQIDLEFLKHSTTRVGDGFVIRYPQIGDAIVDQSLARVVMVPESSEKRPLAELLFSGNVMANILTLRGDYVLHASAVAMKGRAVAYIGPPGRGKSTLAALTCVIGGQLITDDALRLVPGHEGWRCPTGTGVVRLRPQAESIASLLKGSVTQTYDRRIGVTLDLEDTHWPLAALIFPVPSRTRADVNVTRLTEHDALMRLTSFPRVIGWKDPTVLAQSFRWNARLAREVPCYEAILPWGPPFDPSIVAELMNELAGHPQTTG